MKRLLACLIVLLVITLPVPAAQVEAAPTPQDGGTILGEALSLAPTPPIPFLFNGCERVDVAAVNEAFEQSVVDLVNQHRASLAIPAPPLKRVENLDYLARYHAADMAADDYMKHDSYDRDSQGNLVFACDTWVRFDKFVPDAETAWVGENIAVGYSSPQSVMNAWLNSSGHRANIERPQFTEIGVGYYTGGSYGHNWVQDFDSRYNVYPIVINSEAARTASQEVSLYIYGKEDWDEMRLRNDAGTWTAWQAFQENLAWSLPCGAGSHTVSVEMRKTGQTSAGASASDSIFLEFGGGGVTLGNLPASLTFLYGQSSGEFSIPSYAFHPLNSASSQAASWTVTKSDFESDWLTLSANSGVTPDAIFTVIPSNAGGILGILGDHSGTLTIEAASTDPQCPATSTASIPVHLVVVNNLVRGYLPLLMR